MASIIISNLLPAGTSLFSDLESFLDDLSTEELRSSGGLTTLPLPSSVITSTIFQEDIFLSIIMTVSAPPL